MNCLDYRRELLTGDEETGAMRVHRLGCVFCADLFTEQAAFDGELRRALEVPVPAEFAGRRRFLAAAALGAGAAGVGLYVWFGRDDPMAMACIQFVMKDETKSIMMGAMPRAEAERMLADTLPLAKMESIGQIRHVAPCPFGKGTAYHVVLMVPQDKVTLLVMPDTAMPARTRAIHDGMYASVIPLRKGSVGIVGANAAVVDSVASAIRA